MFEQGLDQAPLSHTEMAGNPPTGQSVQEAQRLLHHELFKLVGSHVGKCCVLGAEG
jgi:hypothetical protein